MRIRWNADRQGFLRVGFMRTKDGPVFPPIDEFKMWGLMFGETFVGITRRVRRGCDETLKPTLESLIRDKREAIQMALDRGDHREARRLDREEQALWKQMSH